MQGIKEGMPVSLDRRGYAFPGAGTTIYRNISIGTNGHEMRNVKVRELDFNVAMLVYDGYIDAMMFTMDGYAIDVSQTALTPTLSGEVSKVDDVVRVSRERFIVVGSRELLPISVKVERQQGRVHVFFYQGTPTALVNDEDKWPHADNLNNDTFVLIYENGYNLYTRVGHWTGTDISPAITLDEETLATIRYEYHGVAGMDDKHFVIAATGRQYQVNFTLPSVYACLCTINDDKSIEFGDWIIMPFTISHNFFDMDNMGPNSIIMAFAEESGITTVVLGFDRETNEIYFGSHESIQTGGAILRENRMDLRVLDYYTFAVFYEDDATQTLNMIMAEISDANDIQTTSPTYIISRPFGNRFTDYYFDLCETMGGDFVIAEYQNSGMHKNALVHHGVRRPRPVGIATKVEENKLMIQFAGMFKVSGKKMTPGRAIYTNTKGDIIEGMPFGYANSEFGSYYVFSPHDNSIISSTSLVGIAVTKNKIYMKL